jgi:hypothetical protein
MNPPRTLVDETERLRALVGLKLLDTPPEERFDRVARLAKRIFDVPIVAVTLVDRERYVWTMVRWRREGGSPWA